MIISIIWTAWWLLLLLIIISQIILSLQKFHPVFISIYFIIIFLIFVVMHLFRVGPIAKGLEIVSPSDGKIIDLSNESQVYKKKGLVLLIQCSLLDQWSHVSPVSGVIIYVRYAQDLQTNSHNLMIKIKDSVNNDIHTLHFIMRNMINKLLAKFRYNLFEGQPVNIGDILCVATVNYINWFILSDKYTYEIPMGIKLLRGQYLPLNKKQNKEEDPKINKI